MNERSSTLADRQPSSDGYGRLASLVRELVEGCACPPGGADVVDDNGDTLLLDIKVDGARYLLTRLTVGPSGGAPVLSPREQEIARMVGQGFTNKAIASVLEISTWTVATHLRRIFAKIGVSTRAAMVAKVLHGEPAATATSRPGR